MADAIPHGESLAAPAWRRVHRTIVALVFGHAAFVAWFAWSLGLGAEHAVAEGLLVAAAGVAACLPVMGDRLRAAAAALGLVLASATLTHLVHGAWPGHLHFVLALAAVAFYRDWLPFLAAAATTIGYHAVVGRLDLHSVAGEGAVPLTVWIGAHAAVALALGAALYLRPRRFRLPRRRVDVQY